MVKRAISESLKAIKKDESRKTLPALNAAEDRIDKRTKKAAAKKAPTKKAAAPKSLYSDILDQQIAARGRRRRLIFDTETTGLLKPEVSDLKEQPKIIEFALVEIDEDYNEHGAWSWLINPGEDISEEITKITGLTNADLVGKPAFIEVLPEIETVFFGAHEVVAHNLPFDWGMLTNELMRIGRQFAFPYPMTQTCTRALAHDQFPGQKARLIHLYERAYGKPLEQTHRALDDVRALVDVIKYYRW